MILPTMGSKLKNQRSRTFSWSLPLWFFCVLVLDSLLRVIGAASAVPGTYDFRIIPYRDLVPDGRNGVVEYSNGYVDFSKFVFDTQRMLVIVGARDHLLKLTMMDLAEREVEPWLPDEMTKTLCAARGKPESECHNFIRVLHIQGGELFACGTYAYDPKCSWRSITELRRQRGAEEPGLAKCPFGPNVNTTSLMLDDGTFFSGIVLDFQARDYAIYRIMGRLDPLRTPQLNSQWLNVEIDAVPQFVSSYEVSDYVYFFFREPAVEYTNCGKAVYSRVARVCKNDRGGQDSLLEDNWTTFMKARLNCSIAGDYPFYYDELQSTHLVKEEGLLYAVFTTPINSIHGSAVCVFNMTSLQQTFHGAVKYQATSRMAWERKPNPTSQHQCPPGPDSPSPRLARENLPAVQQLLSNAVRYQLMDKAVQPNHIRPLASGENERWSHIAVDVVHHGTYHVLFVATLDGVVKKLVQLAGQQEACLVEELRLFPEDAVQPIKSMKIMEGFLYVGSEMKLMKLPVHRCGRFKDRRSCLNAMDPYCGWHSVRRVCVEHNQYTVQRMTSCPVTSYRMDGQWSDWDHWQSCEQSVDTMTQCKCRSRRCDNPSPMMGGSPCRGSSIQVVNCTVHGRWGEWSQWSACGATCGQNTRRRRTRHCSSPAPQFGGRGCTGAREETQRCSHNPVCPRDGQWSGWLEWSSCSKQCGGGMQLRRRRCSNPSPAFGGRSCVGNDQDWKDCKTAPCSLKRKSSAWTQWVVANGTRPDGSYKEVRYKFECKANVERDSFLMAGTMKTEQRACSRGGRDCPTNGEIGQPDDIFPNATSTSSDGSGRVASVNGGWSYWSEWTPCSRACGVGSQWRDRHCNSPRPKGNGQDCVGYSIEQKECNIHSCQGEWSCWSSWITCSVSCGHGVRSRLRSCRSSIKGRGYDIPCPGSNKETALCSADCRDNNGWKVWSEWSACASNSMEFRKRDCDVPSPSDTECQGLSREERPCLFNEGEIRLGKTQEQVARGGLGIEHAIGGAVAGFVLGGLVVFAIFMYIRRKERREKPMVENERNHKNEAQPNLYMTTLSTVPSGVSLNNQYCSEQELNAMNITLNTSTLNRQLSRKDSKKDNIKEAKRNSMRTNLSSNDL